MLHAGRGSGFCQRTFWIMFMEYSWPIFIFTLYGQHEQCCDLRRTWTKHLWVQKLSDEIMQRNNAVTIVGHGRSTFGSR